MCQGWQANSSNVELYVNTVIQDLEQEGTYKYFEVSEGDVIQHSLDEREDPERVLPQDPDGTKVWAELRKQTVSHQHLGSNSGKLQCWHHKLDVTTAGQTW